MTSTVCSLPGLDPAVVAAVIDKHRDKPGELLGMLEELQNLDPHKYLPPDILESVAEATGTPVSQVYSVATFYSFFNLQPQGEHVIVVCRGTACHTRGSRGLFGSLKKLLNLRDEDTVAGEKVFLTTADHKFTVKTVACFGQCALAPVVEVDGKMHSHVTEAKLRELVHATAAAKPAGA